MDKTLSAKTYLGSSAVLSWYQLRNALFVWFSSMCRRCRGRRSNWKRTPAVGDWTSPPKNPSGNSRNHRGRDVHSCSRSGVIHVLLDPQRRSRGATELESTSLPGFSQADHFKNSPGAASNTDQHDRWRDRFSEKIRGKWLFLILGRLMEVGLNQRVISGDVGSQMMEAKLF